jgi:hypothetical protein
MTEAGYCQRKDVSGQPVLPTDRSGFREERLGSQLSHHLRASAEDIAVNVGGSDLNVKGCSPPMSGESVGGSIIVRARESRVHGEGSQGIGVVSGLIVA